MNKIVAIVGMAGSGKSIASSYFEENGYNLVYFGGVIYEKMKEEANDKERFNLIEASCSTVPHTTRRKRNSASQTITLSQRTELTCDTQDTKRVREDTKLTSTVSSLIKGAILSHSNQSDLFLIDDFFCYVC